MIVIPPIQITPANLGSSTVAEPSNGEVVWNASTNYTVGTVVIRTTTHRKYESIAGGTDSGLPENTPTRWLDRGPTNKWAMFDQNRNVQTVAANSMVIVLNPGKRINSAAVLGVQAKTVRIVMTAGGNTVYDSGIRNMNARMTNNWTDYFFGAFGYEPTLLLTDLPPYANATITITFSNPGSTVACSGVVLGTKIFLGNTQYNAKSDSLNFSKIDRDEFGNSLLIPRRTVPKTNQTLWTDKELVNNARKARNELNAIPALWSGLDEKYEDPYFEAILIFGIYKQFEIDISQPSVAYINLELEEL